MEIRLWKEVQGNDHNKSCVLKPATIPCKCDKMKKTLKMLLCICIFMSAVSPTNTYADLESNIVYKLNNPKNIQLTNVEIELDKAGETISFEESMENLSKGLSDMVTGNTSTQIYYENEKDQAENTVKVDLDFAGHTIPAPANVMFLMDQSGSMNMASQLKSLSENTTPCVNDDHYYRIRINLKGYMYSYYLNPQEAGLTDSWGSQKTAVLNKIREDAVAAGVADSPSDVISVMSTYDLNDAPESNHFRLADGVTKNGLSLENRFFDIDGSNPWTIVEEELEYFEKIDLGPLEEAGSTELYFSPYSWYNTPGAPETLDWTKVGSDAYFKDLDSKSLCYDRMMISKILFYELSTFSVNENQENKIGFAKYAAKTRESQPLEHTYFDYDVFMETDGYGWTNWSDAYSFADKSFDAVTGGQDMVIMVTDGAPTIGTTSVEGIKSSVDALNSEHGALAFFVGISLSKDTMTKFEEAASTDTTTGEHQAYNGTSLEDFQAIADFLREVLTSATEMKSTLGEIFTLRIDENHPVTVEYVYSFNDEDIKETRTFDSLEAAEEVGLVYDEESNTISWDMHQIGIKQARLSYYEKIDETKVDWETIEKGGQIEGFTNEGTVVDYIDRTGKPSNIEGDETASFTLKNVSYLTIENVTTTPYSVNRGEDIDYLITVKNTGVLTAENVIVRQKIPENTKYKWSDKAVYDEGKNELIYTIPILEAGGVESFSYKATVDANNVEILSSAQLGVSDQVGTLDGDGNPILSAEVLKHKATHHIDPAPVPTDGDRPSTGDSFALAAVITLMLAALIGAVSIAIKKKKFNKD